MQLFFIGVMSYLSFSTKLTWSIPSDAYKIARVLIN